MANTYSQIYIHIVFAVANRASLIKNEWREELHKYITGIIRNNNHKLIAINSMPDHIHIFVGLKPAQSISNLVQDIKANSSRWINEKKLVAGKFNWQTGYGVFSYGHSQINDVVGYIQNQHIHHKKKTFQQEYIEFMKKFNIAYDEKYTFKNID